jgi:hypothetical protein
MIRPCWFILAFLASVCSVAVGQEALLREIEDALRAKPQEVVYDFGHLLKPGGVTELRQLAEGFRADGLHFYFITVPPSSLDVGGLAESVYRDLHMTANDVLFAFDSTRVYGKTLALKGEPQAFADALRAAQPGFRLYNAKGLAAFAQSLRDRIVQRRTDEVAKQQAAVERQRRLWASVVVLLVAAVSIVAYWQLQRRSVARKQYDDRLREAENLFQQVAVNMPLGGLSLQEVALGQADDVPQDLYEDKDDTPDDLATAIQTLQDKVSQGYEPDPHVEFDVVLKHDDGVLSYVIDLDFVREHQVGVDPIVITVTATPSTLRRSAEEDQDAYQQRISGYFETQDRFDQAVDAWEEHLVSFLNDIADHFRTNFGIDRLDIKTRTIWPEASAAEGPQALTTFGSPLYGYDPVSDLAHIWLWETLRAQHPFLYHHEYLPESEGLRPAPTQPHQWNASDTGGGGAVDMRSDWSPSDAGGGDTVDGGSSASDSGGGGWLSSIGDFFSDSGGGGNMDDLLTGERLRLEVLYTLVGASTQGIEVTLDARPQLTAHARVVAFQYDMATLYPLAADGTRVEARPDPSLVLIGKVRDQLRVKWKRINATTAQLLSLCNGTRTVQAIIDEVTTALRLNAAAKHTFAAECLMLLQALVDSCLMALCADTSGLRHSGRAHLARS